MASQIKTKLDDVIAKLKSYQLVQRLPVRHACLAVRRLGQRTGSNNWVPYYTLHKILAGLLDVYEFEENADALAVASKLGDWLYNRAIGLERERQVAGSRPGVRRNERRPVRALQAHEQPNHLTVAHVFDDTSLFTTLAAGTDTLSGKHANMTIPKFIGALNRYRTVGSSESSYLNAASGFFDIVLKRPHVRDGGKQRRRALPHAQAARLNTATTSTTRRATPTT